MNQEPFSIKANTYTLLAKKEETLGIFEQGKYTIPIYQRPYSWDTPQLDRFIKSIVKAYQEGQSAYFLGTVQLRPPKEKNGRYQIIDGQQRFTTILLLLKALAKNEAYPFDRSKYSLFSQFDWLETKVNKGEQQQYLEAVIEDQEIKEELNIYFRNYRHIQQLLDGLRSKEEEEQEFEINDSFINYCFYKLYFVVIETRASLSKTLDIFNTINTAGMDLNGGDLFKIQLFDYLTRIKKREEDVFDEIDSLYASIDQVNKEIGKVVCTIDEVLKVYKFILISKNVEGNVLHSFGQNTFYERLFQVLLNKEKIEHFDRNKFLNALGLKDLERLVEVRKVWEKLIWGKNNKKAEHQNYIALMWWSRYSSFWILDLIYLYRFYTEKNFDTDKFTKFTELYFKYAFMFSVRYQKAVTRAKNFYYGLIRQILNEQKTVDDIIGFLKDEIKKQYTQEWDFNQLIWHLNANNIFEITRKKNLLVRLSAILAEKGGISYKGAHQKYFEDSTIDIEHIQAKNPKKGLPEEWQPVINTLGNLVVLESNHNRSIQNKSFEIKQKTYKESKFPIVQQFVSDKNYADGQWAVEKCKARTKTEVEKTVHFLFEGIVDDKVQTTYRKAKEHH